MEKFIPYEKLSKKKQRELNARKRKTWGDVNPVTRRTENPKAYNRQKARKWNDDSDFAPFLYFLFYKLPTFNHKTGLTAISSSINSPRS